MPFNFAERTGARGDIYTKKLLRHAFVGGHGSFVYWQRSNGEGPYLVMTPVGDTKFEYFDSSGGVFTPYIHAAAAMGHGSTPDSAAAEAGFPQASRIVGIPPVRWRLPTSALTLAPKQTVRYAFRFQWAKDFAGVRDVLFNEGKFDIAVAPGMVVPTDLTALISLRTKNTITGIEPEHGRLNEDRTPSVLACIESASPVSAKTCCVSGTAMASGRRSSSSSPSRSRRSSRSAPRFSSRHHQHNDPSKWYVGVYGDWDQKNELLRSPEDRDGLSTWLTDANDDAGNARPAFIASKNVFFPDQKEIESLELYISKYLWGGMQMTDKEKYPYAIYGIPNFKANRASPDPGRNGQAHVWRIYDYPHIVMLYYRMFHIAKFYPDKVKHLDAATYLERAYRTAVAYWTVPMEVEKWSANAVGTMNEAFIPELIDTLEREGKKELGRHAPRLLGGQGRALRDEDAEPVRIGVRVRFDRLRIHRCICEVRIDS